MNKYPPDGPSRFAITILIVVTLVMLVLNLAVRTLG